jgi:hypothetical protein
MKSYPWDSHDIGITSLVASKTVVAEGFDHVSISAIMFNYGDFDETFNVTFRVNETVIGEFNYIYLLSRDFEILSVDWNTSILSKGIYTIEAVADKVPYEIDIADNTVVCYVVITVQGDINGDQICNMQDILIMINKFLCEPDNPKYEANVDTNNDLIIDMADIDIAITHFQESWQNYTTPFFSQAWCTNPSQWRYHPQNPHFFRSLQARHHLRFLRNIKPSFCHTYSNLTLGTMDSWDKLMYNVVFSIVSEWMI